MAHKRSKSDEIERAAAFRLVSNFSRVVKENCIKKVIEEFRVMETYHADDRDGLLLSNITRAIREG